MTLTSRRPRYADVAATLALVIAMGGTAYAALPKNAVGAKQIKAGAVRAAEIKTGAVRSAEIRHGAVGAQDLATGSVGTVDVQDGGVTGSDVAGRTLGVRHFEGAEAVVDVSAVINQDECVPVTVSVPGAEVGQAVLLTPQESWTSFAVGLQAARVSGPNQVTLYVCSSEVGQISIGKTFRVVTLG